MKRLTATFAAAVALAVVCFAPIGAAGADPIVIKFSHVVSPDAPKGKAALLFKQLAEKYTNGKVTVEVYPNSSLYKDKEELEALQLGSVQLLAPSISKFGPLGVKEFDVFDLPFLMVDDARAHQMTSSPMMADLNKKLEAKGVSPLAYWDNGTYVYTSNVPLISPDDFRGLKMRIQGSKVLDAVARQLGAIPQIIAFGELYQALQTGVVDGEDNVPSNIWTQKFYDVQKYLTVSYHGRLTYSLITNVKFWNSLPADVRPGLDRAVKESTEFFNETAAKDNAQALKDIAATGRIQMHTLTDTEKQAWINKLMPVHKEMEGRFGKEFIQNIYKASGFVPPQS
ncbi:MAG TPA: DctP family TRAP transporter solute-binding subunit [Xanthobacteraceae bacterium]|jgi:C4-dicarboxylate-binding protein DctP|nr:DctP family TRAP transporter solute-binding subunit [Xanthobacteraceae bacterium]